jgi:hypothetical protein
MIFGFFVILATFISFTHNAILVVPSDRLPYFQTFDTWDLCYYDGVCYEQRCDNLRGGFYNPIFQDNINSPDGIERRHWWVSDIQTSSNWNPSRVPVACGSLTTGPCNDHTLGAGDNGRFMYAETSACNGVQFHLITPSIAFSNASKVISFWYYQFGTDLGTTPLGYLTVEASSNNGSSWQLLTTITNPAAPGTAAWQLRTLPLDGVTGFTVDDVVGVFRFIYKAGGNSGGAGFRQDFAIDDIFITQDGANANITEWVDYNCTSDPACIPLETTSTTGVLQITGGDGDGLTEEEIIGIVIGIVGGAICLCCCLCILLIILLLIISPRKPPDGGGDL